MSKVNWKTMVPALVAASILIYEAYTGHQVNGTVQNELNNFSLTLIGVIGTVWGMIVNHKKR